MTEKVYITHGQEGCIQKIVNVDATCRYDAINNMVNHRVLVLDFANGGFSPIRIAMKANLEAVDAVHGGYSFRATAMAVGHVKAVTIGSLNGYSNDAADIVLLDNNDISVEAVKSILEACRASEYGCVMLNFNGVKKQGQHYGFADARWNDASTAEIEAYLGIVRRDSVQLQINVVASTTDGVIVTDAKELQSNAKISALEMELLAQKDISEKAVNDLATATVANTTLKTKVVALEKLLSARASTTSNAGAGTPTANTNTLNAGTPTANASAPTANASAPNAGAGAPTANTSAPNAGASAPTANASAPNAGAGTSTANANISTPTANASTLVVGADTVSVATPKSRRRQSLTEV